MEHELSRVVDALPGLVWTARPDGTVDFLNRRWCEYTGLRMHEAIGHGWHSAIHPDDLAGVLERWTVIHASGNAADMEVRLRRVDGEYRRFLIRTAKLNDASGALFKWCGLNTDIEDQIRAEDALRAAEKAKRGEVLLAGERQLLEMVARGLPMPEILDALCRFVENTAGECYCSVVLVDSSGTRLEHGAAPSLPASFVSSIIGRPINMDSGPCAMASCLNEQVIAPDLNAETRWATYAWSSMALAHGLQACWSTPITSASGKVLGAFAIYYRKPTAPTPLLQSLIEQFTHIASITVEGALRDAALRRSEASYRAIVETTPECVKIVARDGTVLRVNSAGVAMAGAPSAEAVVGQCFYDFLAAEDRGRYRAFNEAVCAGQKGILEFALINLQGERRQMETHASPYRQVDGSIAQLGVTREITHHKQAEQELRRSQAFLAEAQRLNSSGSFSWLLEPNEFTWSEQLYRIFDFDHSVPVTLERIGARYHPEDAAVLSDMVRRATSDGSDWEYEHRLLMPDQSIKYLHVVAHAIRHHDGRLEYIGAVQDVTERRLSEAALNKVRSELAHVARVTTLGALTASIAHEVNQPLSGIITNASTCLRMLASEPPNIDGARETARRTIRDGNRASDVITRLRALFSKKEVALESVDLNEATREVIALSLSDLQRGRVVLQPELADDLPRVTGDRVQLQQVILNLLRNAADAMSGVEDRPRHLVVSTARDGGGHVRLAVRDAGVGFEPLAADKLFDAFYTTKSDGMGIGLSVSRSIIESHHGSLSAAPNEGPGATFSFSIPREAAVTLSARSA